MPPNQDNRISVGKFREQVFTGNPLFWTIVLLISLVIPLLGFIISVYLLVKAIRLHKRRLYYMAAATLAASLVGVGLLRFSYNLIYNQKLDYTYSALDEYKLPSKLAGAELTFQKPTEIKYSNLRLQEGSAVASLVHTNKKTKPDSGIAYIYAGSVQSALATSESYIKARKEGLSSKNSQNYQIMVKPIIDFIKGNTSDKYDVQILSVSPLSTSNIKDNAWKFDLTIRGGGGSVKTIKPLNGNAIMAFGKNTFYYFTVMAIENNWDSNQKVWQQVLDSVKVDQ